MNQRESGIGENSNEKMQKKATESSYHIMCEWGGCLKPARMWSNVRYLCFEHFRTQQRVEAIEENGE